MRYRLRRARKGAKEEQMEKRCWAVTARARQYLRECAYLLVPSSIWDEYVEEIRDPLGEVVDPRNPDWSWGEGILSHVYTSPCIHNPQYDVSCCCCPPRVTYVRLVSDPHFPQEPRRSRARLVEDDD